MVTETAIREQLRRALDGESGDGAYDGAVAKALCWVLADSLSDEAPYLDDNDSEPLRGDQESA